MKVQTLVAYVDVNNNTWECITSASDHNGVYNTLGRKKKTKNK